MKNILILLICVCLTGCKANKVGEVETCKVSKGLFYIDLVEEGEIHATTAINISSPSMSWQFGPLKITEIVENKTVCRSAAPYIPFSIVIHLIRVSLGYV